MKPKLILHVGSPKTGTTSIQEALSARRAWLESAGVGYPDARPFFGGAEAHHRLAHALAGKDVARPDQVRAFGAHLAEIARRHERILLSAEPFSRNTLSADAPRTGDRGARRLEGRRRYLARVAEFLDGFDVEIVIFFRRPDDFAVSLYKNSVVSRPRAGGFERFLKQPEFRLDYATQVEVFGAYFPKVTARAFEAALGQGIVATFLETIGLPPPPGLEAPELRRSITNEAALWIDQWKREQAVDLPRLRRLWQFAMLPDAAPLFAGGRGSSLWRSVEQRDAFIVQLGGKLPAQFFPPPAAELPPPAAWSDADHKKASAAFRKWERLQVGRPRLRELVGLKRRSAAERAGVAGLLAKVRKSWA